MGPAYWCWGRVYSKLENVMEATKGPVWVRHWSLVGVRQRRRIGGQDVQNRGFDSGQALGLDAAKARASRVEPVAPPDSGQALGLDEKKGRASRVEPPPGRSPTSAGEVRKGDRRKTARRVALM